MRPSAGNLVPLASRSGIIRAEKRHSERRSGEEPAEIPTGAEIEQIAERLMIAEALRRLPERTRRVIEMHYFEGWTHSEIAQKASLPLGTVKSTIHRGLGKIRYQLESADE